MQEGHTPVMPVEVLEALAPAPGSLQIDATLGGGGHTERILEAASPDGRVLGLDADQLAIDRVGARLARFGDRLVLRQANFRELADVAPAAGFAAIDGALFDLGLSSYQLADRDRGFGFRAGGPLDMRFDTTQGVPASDLLATMSADDLAALFRKYGEEPAAWKIAKAIVAARTTSPVETAEDLARRAHRAGQPSPAPAHPSGHARVPGAPDRGQRGARRAGGRPCRCAPAAPAGRPPGRPVLPLARGPHRQAVPQRGASRLHVSTVGTGVHLREAAPPAPRHTPIGRAQRGRDRHQSPGPERAHACRRAARGLTGQEEDEEEKTGSPTRRPAPLSIRTQEGAGPSPRRRSPVSKRHQSNRRKNYGRRQHELYERRQRDHQSEDLGMVADDLAGTGIADRFAFLDPRTPRLHYATGD
jgi:hypothetical protein